MQTNALQQDLHSSPPLVNDLQRHTLPDLFLYNALSSASHT